MLTTKHPTLLLAALALGIFAAACGEETGPPIDTGEKPLQCDTSKYVAFAAANHLTQTEQLAAHKTMSQMMGAAVMDPAVAAANFTMAETAYNTASFRTDVQAVTDLHFDPPRAVGGEIDQTIIDGLARGKTATTAAEAKIASEMVSKGLIRYFFTAINHGAMSGTAGGWDRAQVYYGAGADLTANMKVTFAEFTAKRDGANGTNFTAQIFNSLLDGSCELATELKAKNTTEVDYSRVTKLKPIVDKLDLDMQKVIAFYVAHEAFEINEEQIELRQMSTRALLDSIEVKRIEADVVFRAIEPLITPARAAAIRVILDVEKNDPTEAWKETIDASQIVEELEAEYSIDVRG